MGYDVLQSYRRYPQGSSGNWKPDLLPIRTTAKLWVLKLLSLVDKRRYTTGLKRLAQSD
jgi:hypothetical protein